MLRSLASLVLLLGFGSAFATTTGVAFVHGTGSQTDAYNDYWQPAMVNSVRQGLANQANYVVINCDFTQYMWTAPAAGCLATQLTNFINTKHIDDLVVITHSNGGNVMRWILSNPTYDSRYPAIIKATRWVNAIAPSSAGTPLANAVMAGNVFEASLGWLLGYQNDAVRQQQTSWMAYYTRKPARHQGTSRATERLLGYRRHGCDLLAVQLRFVLRRLHAQRRTRNHAGVARQLLRWLHRVQQRQRRRHAVVLRPQHAGRKIPVAQPEPARVFRPGRRAAQRSVSGELP